MFTSYFQEPQSESASLVAEADSTLQKVLLGSEDVNTETTCLKAQLDKLLIAYQTRETQFTASVAEVKGKYGAIIKEATDKANSILAAAQKATEESAKIAAESLSASERTAAETLKTTTEKNNKLIADALAQATAIQVASANERAAWEAEKASVADIQKSKPVVKVNVGGTKFTTSLTTLCRFPDTMIGTMYSGRHELVQDEDGYHFIDRDGTHFRYILNFLRSPETFECELTGAALKEFKNECDYYGLKELMFPFVPIPAFACNNPYGYSVAVSQNLNGVWIVKDQPLKICTHCFRADYSHCGTGHPHGYMYFDTFQSTVQARGGAIDWSVQPKPTPTCGGCGRAQV